MSKIKKLNDIVKFLCSKYRHIEEDLTRDIINNFMKVCKQEMLNGNTVQISRIGKFIIKQKAEKKSKDFRGKPRIIPKMWVPYFRTSSTFRDYINSEE